MFYACAITFDVTNHDYIGSSGSSAGVHTRGSTENSLMLLWIEMGWDGAAEGVGGAAALSLLGMGRARYCRHREGSIRRSWLWCANGTGPRWRAVDVVSTRLRL